MTRHDKQTTKLRNVYDASARFDGPSLNDCLHSGPKFDQRIFDILLRFRAHQVAVTADIEKAFLMVSVARKDCDVLRFLWVDDLNKDQPDIAVLRFTRVVFGVSSSPFLLNATIRHHLEHYRSTHPDLVHKLSTSTYVDDIVTGGSNEEQAYHVYKESKKILEQGGFNLRKFSTNLTQLQERIDAETVDSESLSLGSEPVEETYASSTLGSIQRLRPGEQKMLGVQWNIVSDRLVTNLDQIASAARELEPTMRNVVALVGKFYDPLGPVVVLFKIFFQEL